VDADSEPDSWEWLGGEDTELAVRDGVVLVPRLARIRDTDAGQAPQPPRPVSDGPVLITGGTGLLGGLLARHLARRHGVRHLVLVSKRGMDAAGAAELVAELEGLGATVTVAACDATDRQALADVIGEFPPTGIVHAAGVLDDGMVGSLSADRLATVMRPKVDGARWLDELTRDLDLAWFVTFSSASGVLGSPGQSSYAAANVYLDALVTARRARGLPGLSLAWGLWEQASEMTAHLSGAGVTRIRRSGMSPLTAETGLALFDAAVALDVPVQIPARLDLRVWRARAAAGGIPPLLRGLITAPARRSLPADTDEGSGLRDRLAGQPDEAQQRIVLDFVTASVAAVLGHRSAAELDAERGFFDLGFDSMTVVELRNSLNAATGLRLSVAFVFDHPTSSDLAAHLLVMMREG
jgi:NAD(P)-dependent dehydrogenase (short-subunit alcohol dehydrogenase family)